MGADGPTPAAVNTGATELPSYASLTERLILAQQHDAEQASDTRSDPFALPEQWQTDRSKPLSQSEDKGTKTASSQRLTAIFKLNGTVRSVIDGNEEIMAVISGGGLTNRAVRVGQKIRVPNDKGVKEEFVLVKIDSRYVVWQSQATNERVEMRVDEDL